jgi:D-mannonate dehydratase
MENKKKFYLSRKLLDLRTQILPNQPSPTDRSRQPMWLGEIGGDPVIRETLAKRIEEALRAIEEADAACSREWALHFIDQVRPVTSSAGVRVDCCC